MTVRVESHHEPVSGPEIQSLYIYVPLTNHLEQSAVRQLRGKLSSSSSPPAALNYFFSFVFVATGAEGLWRRKTKVVLKQQRIKEVEK